MRTPIYAADEGCVSLAQESYQAYGATIRIEANIGGYAVSTVY